MQCKWKLSLQQTGHAEGYCQQMKTLFTASDLGQASTKFILNFYLVFAFR
jgi:hypothetical protein